MVRISIALCTYNGAAYLPAQLESLLAQTLRPSEIIINDDGSTDETWAILEAFQNQAPADIRVDLHRNETNLGVAKNFEAAFRRCTGQFIAPCDQDDVWLPHKLDHLVKALDDDPARLLAFCDAHLLKEERVLRSTMWASLRFTPAEQRAMQRGQAIEVLLKHRVVTGAAMLFRREALDMALPISADWIHDAWLSAIFALAGKLVPVATPLIMYRLHGQNQIGTMDVSAGGQLQTARQSSAETYHKRAHEYMVLRDHLAHRLPNAALDGVQGKIDHLMRRATRPQSRVARARQIGGELLEGDYGRYASGWRSAIRDLLF